jgi:hypothetical protein
VVPKSATKDTLVVIKGKFNFLVESEVADFQKQEAPIIKKLEAAKVKIAIVVVKFNVNNFVFFW